MTSKEMKALLTYLAALRPFVPAKLRPLHEQVVVSVEILIKRAEAGISTVHIPKRG